MLRDLMNKTFQGQIAEGKHSAVITKWEFIDNAARPDFAYIKLSMLIDGSREYVRNMFEKDMSIFLSHSRTQLGRENEDIQPTNYLNELISKKTALDIWFTYPVVNARNGLKKVQNISWLAPLVDETATPADYAEEDMDSPL